ncbi:MAG: hypothetical protein ACTSU2_01950 [Promethearchaeota archaeon]
MEKKSLFRIIMYGDAETVENFGRYLGFTPKSKRGLVYFEFPNEKFKNETFKMYFNFRITFYMLQPQLLNTIMAPQVQFKQADIILVLYNPDNDSIYNECFEYFKKFALTRKSFIPMLFISYTNISTNSPDGFNRRIENIFRGLVTAKTYEELFGIRTYYLNIYKNKNEQRFFPKIKNIFESGIDIFPKEYSSLTIERMLVNLENKLEELREMDITLDLGIKTLGEFERNRGGFIERINVTRRKLTKEWGLIEEDARDLMNLWEKRIDVDDISQDDLNLLENDALAKLNRIQQLGLQPNLINLLSMSYGLDESKKALVVLKKLGYIKSVAFHVPSEEFEIYDNLQDLIIMFEGKQIYLMTKDSNTERINILSGMLSAIEMIRNKYLPFKENINNNYYPKNNNQKTGLHIKKVDILEFGNLHCIMGVGNKGLSVTLRFKESPQKLYLDKTESFIQAFEKKFADLLTPRKVYNQNEYRNEIDDLFFIYYNPFPRGVHFSKELEISHQKYRRKYPLLTEMEKNIIKLIEKYGSLDINNILEKIEEDSDGKIAKSDVLPVIFDLIFEHILE